MLTDSLHWCMATIHQHKPDTASYQDYLKMSGSEESSQQKGWGKGKFSTMRQKTQDGQTEEENKNLSQSVVSSVTTDMSSL